MQDASLIYNKLTTLPEQMKTEVSDFIDFLLEKAKREKNAINTPKAKFGSAKGMFKISDDFDEQLDDFKDYM